MVLDKEGFMALFFMKEQAAHDKETVRSLLDFVFYETPKYGPDMPYIELMAYVWLKDEQVVRGLADEEPGLAGFVELFDRSDEADFAFMTDRVKQAIFS